MKWRRSQLLLPYYYVLPALSFQLSVFSKLCIMNILLYFLLLCQSCRSLSNVSFGDRVLGLIKCTYHGWLSMMTSSEGPLFVLPWAPPTLNPPSASFRGDPKGPGPRVSHQRGPPTMFMCLATCAYHLVIFSEESLFKDAINYIGRPNSSRLFHLKNIW